MINSLRNNPILVHQVHKARWPSARAAAAVAVVLTLAGLNMTIIAFVIRPLLLVSAAIYLGVPALGMLGPLITSITATVSTAQAIKLEKKGVLDLSRLSDRDKVRGYIARALFKLRFLWMIIGGLTLPFVIATIQISALLINYFTCPNQPTIHPGIDCPPPPSPPEAFTLYASNVLIITLFFVVLLIAWNWLAINLGVWMACRYHDHDLGSTALVIFSLIWPVIISPAAVLSHQPAKQAACIALAAIVISMISGWLVYRRAVKRVGSIAE